MLDLAVEVPIDVVVLAHPGAGRPADDKVFLVAFHATGVTGVGIQKLAVQVQADLVIVEGEGEVIVFVRFDLGAPVDKVLLAVLALVAHLQMAVAGDIGGQMAAFAKARMVFREQRLVLPVAGIVGAEGERKGAFVRGLTVVMRHLDGLVGTAEGARAIVHQHVGGFQTLGQDAGQIDLAAVVPLVG